MTMKHYGVFFLGLLVCLCVGCASLNPAVKDPAFQAAFKGHKIRGVAPASGVESDDIKRLYALKSLSIEIPPNLMSDAIAFHANTDEERFLVLKKALYDDSRDTVIWSLRGGYGSARVLGQLKNLPKPKQEKIFIGYSDITALHLFLAQNWRWKTIHGGILSELLEPSKNPENFKRIADIVAKRVTELKIPSLVALNYQAVQTTKITGRLTGGNLTLVQTSIGTAWQIQAANKILFLEEVGEKGYQIDRSLNHLKQAGILKNVKAIVFGDFANSKDDKVTLALERFALETNIPIFKTDKFGHGKTNYPLVYNAKTDIIPTLGSKDFTLLMHLRD